MSYNIDTWKTKELDGLIISLKAFYDADTNKWMNRPVITDADPPMEISIEGGSEDMEIVGMLVADQIQVTSIRVRGEGSGHFYHDVLLPVLAQSTGALVASLVWEGGDSVTRLTVRDGKITDEDIDL